jgi:hypothetical protein
MIDRNRLLHETLTSIGVPEDEAAALVAEDDMNKVARRVIEEAKAGSTEAASLALQAWSLRQ